MDEHVLQQEKVQDSDLAFPTSSPALARDSKSSQENPYRLMPAKLANLSLTAITLGCVAAPAASRATKQCLAISCRPAQADMDMPALRGDVAHIALDASSSAPLQGTTTRRRLWPQKQRKSPRYQRGGLADWKDNVTSLS